MAAVVDSSPTPADVVINFKLVSGGAPFSITVDKDSAIQSVRAEVSTKCGDAPVASIRLIYKGKVLKDEETLATHGFKNGETFIVSVGG